MEEILRNICKCKNLPYHLKEIQSEINLMDRLLQTAAERGLEKDGFQARKNQLVYVKNRILELSN